MLIQKDISSLRAASYLLVTYAIEVRAAELYPIYDQILRSADSPIAVKSILLEEKEHLNEMREGLKNLPSGFTHAEQICAIENSLYKIWLDSIERTIYNQWNERPRSKNHLSH